MYNRYTPQGDGSYRRNSMPDPGTPAPAPKPPVPQPSPPIPAKNGELLGIGRFFRQLLPRELDMEDLLIVVLLLLMSGNQGEDQNFALLTLALYLFL